MFFRNYKAGNLCIFIILFKIYFIYLKSSLRDRVFPMEIAFKNTITTTKGKQCQEFLSILKKLKFLLSTKDRQLSFYVDKDRKKFMITTFSNRNLDNPPAGSPTFYIDYEFGQDIYSMSSFQMDSPNIMFSFQIQETVRLINHYYQTKMSIMKLSVESDLMQGSISFEVPDEVQGLVPLYIQKLQRFPYKKPYLDKDHVQCIPLFTLSEQNFQQLKELQDIKYQCWYEIHEEGIYLKNYNKELQGNNFLLNKDFLGSYNSIQIKERVRGNVFIQEAQNFLIDEVKVGIKKHYKKMQVNLIVVRRPQFEQYIKFSYIEIESNLSVFPKSIKRVISNCQLSTEINPEGFMIQNQQMQNMPLEGMNNDLLKSEEPGLEDLRRIVINRWVPRSVAYYEDRFQFEREKQAFTEKQQFIEETKTRKIFYKIEDKY